MKHLSDLESEGEDESEGEEGEDVVAKGGGDKETGKVKKGGKEGDEDAKEKTKKSGKFKEDPKSAKVRIYYF